MLGGSFNPAHQGHKEISIAALEALNLDGVVWLVTPGNPLKDQSLYADYKVRFQKAIKVSDHQKIYVSDFEHVNNLRYSAQTIDAIKTVHPNINFSWLLGADSFANFHLWRDWEKIFQSVPIIVLNRPDYKEAALDSIAAKTFVDFQKQCGDVLQSSLPAWCFINKTQNPLSSTAIRKQDANEGKKTKRVFEDTHDNKQEGIMMTRNKIEGLTEFLNLNPALSDFKADLLEGLSAPQKNLSPKHFYDETGSELFFDITQTPEYYPTRTELALMRQHMPEIKEAIGAQAAIFEYGSGASEKIKLLLDSLERVHAYVAMDISQDYLLESAQTIAREYPDLSVSAVCADFNQPIKLPYNFHPEVKKWVGYFPGSTIGNFPAGAATEFLTRASETLGGGSLEEGSQFLLGFDLKKDEKILNAAYNDRAGVTAAFNLNLLKRMQNELGAQLTIEDFAHDAFYNNALGRIEMHLRAIKETDIVIPNIMTADGSQEKRFSFSKGESLHTEFSYKYTKEIMESMIAKTPWHMSHYWTDENEWFAMCLLCNKSL